MSILSNKNLLLIISGGIAAYKACDLCRKLKEQGANVRVVMTNGAKAFVQPLTLQALSGNRVSDDLLDSQAEAAMGHIELARWAEMIIIAPASANCIARITHGMADDLLTTLCLASKAPIAIAPAMNQAMWENPYTQENIARLKINQIHCLGPAAGSQACGDIGYGRMLEPQDILAHCERIMTPTLPAFTGKHIVITAGPTREALDPVRYLSNHSSGKMGYALAQAALQQGANVTLISGPVQTKAPDQAKLFSVISAQDMYQKAMEQAPGADIFIACAAVADYRPVNCSEQKLKKQGNSKLTLTLEQNPDIVAAVAALDSNRPFTIGFAAETDHISDYAKSKLQSKNLDMIIANDVSQRDIGFNSENNAATVYWPQGEQEITRMSKADMAMQILKLAKQQLKYYKGN